MAWPGEEGLFVRSLLKIVENTLQLGYSKDRGVWGKYKMINCGRLLSVPLGIMGPLH